MATYEDLDELRRLEEQAKFLGFKLTRSSYDPKMIAISPVGDETDLDMTLPIFSRNAEIYTGTSSTIAIFLHGWIKGQQYIKSVLPKSVTEEKIKIAESKIAKINVDNVNLREQNKTLALLKS